jgi:hypothetical protein
MATGELAVVERPALAPRSTLAPTTFEEAKQFASYLAESELVPKQYIGKPANIVVAIQHGMEIGLAPLQAMQSIAVINGRPSLWGDSMLALVMSHPAYEEHSEEIEGSGDQRVAVFTIKRKNQKAHTVRFSVDDAKRAGLWQTEASIERFNRDTKQKYTVPNDSPWYRYPERMLKMRARGFALRDKFPDALRGMISREEAEDYSTTTIEGEVVQTTAVSQPGKQEPAVAIVKITQDQARDFGKTWKGSGFTIAGAKETLKTTCGVDSSLDIPTDKYEAVMRWASKNPNWPKDFSPSREEEIAREMFGILNYDLAKQAAAIEESKGDWSTLVKKLNAELPAE